MSFTSNKGSILIRWVFAIFLIALAAHLCGCTTTTSVKPNNPALATNESDISEQGSRLRDMSAPDLIKIGNTLLVNGNLEMARIYFSAAIGRDPQNPLPYVGVADIDYRTGNYQAAMLNYQKASSIDPQNLAAILGQIQILRAQGDLNAAHDQLSRAMQFAPNDVRVLTELAITYNLQGQESLAAPLFKEVAAKTPETATTFNNVGVNELSRGNYALAIVNLSKAFMLDNKNETTVNNLAMAFALYGQEDQALKLYSNTVGEAGAWNNIGYLYLTQKRYEDAERALRKALEINPRFYAKAKENLDKLKQLRQAER